MTLITMLVSGLSVGVLVGEGTMVCAVVLTFVTFDCRGLVLIRVQRSTESNIKC